MTRKQKKTLWRIIFSFVLLAAVGIGLTSPLLRLMHTPQDTIKPAESYLKIIFTGVPFLAVYNV